MSDSDRAFLGSTYSPFSVPILYGFIPRCLVGLFLMPQVQRETPWRIAAAAAHVEFLKPLTSWRSTEAILAYLHLFPFDAFEGVFTISYSWFLTVFLFLNCLCFVIMSFKLHSSDVIRLASGKARGQWHNGRGESRRSSVALATKGLGCLPVYLLK